MPSFAEIVHSVPTWIALAMILVGIGRVLENQKQHGKSLEAREAQGEDHEKRITSIEARHAAEDRAAPAARRR